MKEDFLLEVDNLISTVEWKHKETYEDILEYIENKVESNKKEQQSLKEYYTKKKKKKHYLHRAL